jgi:hypothetical protein
MNKEEYIKRHGEAAYEKLLEYQRVYYEEHQEEKREQSRTWNESHPEEVIASSHEKCRKGGKYYDKQVIYQRTSLQGARNSIRLRHRSQYRPYKQIIAPDSQIHHQWIPDTSEYTGVALVEADQHMHGIIDVFMILDGEITVFDEHAGVYK